MQDGTFAAIDRFFDLIDFGVDHVDRILHRGELSAARHRSRLRRRADGVESEVSPPPAPKTSKRPSTSSTVSRSTAKAAATTALSRKSKFYIVEAVTSAGDTEFVVTDGGNARAACPSRAVAEQILRALEKSQ